jgi:hypothetical protein
MRCNICDKQLTDKEVQWNKELKQYEPCTECLEIAMDAAYSDGHGYDDFDLHFVPLVDDSFDESVSLTRDVEDE